MPTVTHAETEAKRAAVFTCTSCGHTATVTGRGFGDGAAQGGGALAAVEAIEKAHADAEADIERNLNVLKCPACGYRVPLAAFSWWMRHVFGPALLAGGLISVLAVLAAASKQSSFVNYVPIIGVVIFVALSAALLPRAFSRWNRLALDRVEDRTQSALEVFMDHAQWCKTCDIDKGKRGLCDKGKQLYRAKELAERR